MANGLKDVSPEVMLDMINKTRRWNDQPEIQSLEQRDPRAVAKLARSEQCEIKAFCLCGVPRNVIASIFDVTSLTVTRINNATANKYPWVFIELNSFNTKREFCTQYITEENESRVRALHPSFRRPED